MSAHGTLAPPQDDHVSDADLVRLLDGEPAPRLGGDASAHLASCADCSARFATLRARSFSLSALLLATDAPVPAPERLRPPARLAARRTPRLRIAAALLVAAAGIAAAATPEVRGWIATRASRHAPSRDVGPPPRPVPAPDAGGAVIGFAAERPELTVQVTLPQTSGVLELRAGDGALANAEVVRGNGEGLVVLPGTLQIRNRDGSTASYAVTLPPGVTTVTVQIGNAAPRRVTRAAVLKEGSIRLPLSAH